MTTKDTGTPGTHLANARAPELEHALKLADRHCPNIDIAGDLVCEFGLSWDQATRFVEGNADALQARRARFRCTLRAKFDEVSRGEGEDCRSSYQLHALAKQVENYLGWKASDDKAKPKAGGPRLVKAS